MAWLPLRGCSVIEANLAVGLLEDAGILSRVVDAAGIEIPREYLAPVDFQVILEVHENDVAAARAFLDDALPLNTGRRLTNADLQRDVGPVTRDAESIAALGLRIRYCAVSPFAPFGLWLAWEYLLRTRLARVRPPGHGWNIAGIVACVPASFFCAFALYQIFSS